MRLALAALAALVALATACGGDTGDRLTRARRILDDADRFETGLDAGDAFVEVGELLLADARACTGACDTRFQAAAYAQVFALRVLGCTAPGRLEARTGLATYLDAVAAGSEDPEAPALPACPAARNG